MEPYRPFIDQIAYKLHAAKKKVGQRSQGILSGTILHQHSLRGTDGAVRNMSHLHHRLRRKIFHGRNQEHFIPEVIMWVVTIFDFPRHCKSGRHKDSP